MTAEAVPLFAPDPLLAAVQAWSVEEWFGNHHARVADARRELRAALKAAGGDPNLRSGVVRNGARSPR